MTYATENIRNIALLGHGGNGKTSLAESMLFLAGSTDRLGKTADGNTVSDYDPEEIRRQTSISASTMFAEYNKVKINIIDTPGYFDFTGEVFQALRVADAGIIVISAKDGLNVGAEKAWKYFSDMQKPRAIYISKTDEEHADFYNTFEQIREKFGTSVSPMTAPIMEGEKVTGIVDIISKKAFKIEGGKRTEIGIPADMTSRVEDFYNEIAENAAGTSEELMEKYLDTMELSSEEIYGALNSGIAGGEICPVFFGSAYTGLGTI
ncbi:MAG: GTP-binding protein, partial [Oscillospiraceae bacterium]|nr:GTP-binding protein [Oscillospiraceae bacterium]